MKVLIETTVEQIGYPKIKRWISSSSHAICYNVREIFYKKTSTSEQIPEIHSVKNPSQCDECKHKQCII